MIMGEIFDLFDGERNFLFRQIPKGEKKNSSEFNLIVHIWLQWGDKFLITQRAHDIFWGGYWQPTGGHVRAGELSFQAALRETAEEIGLNPTNLPSRYLFSYKCVADGVKRPNSFFLDAWLFDISSLVEDHKSQKDFFASLNFQPDEVIDGRFATFDEIKSLHADGLFMPFEETYENFWQDLQSALFNENLIPGENVPNLSEVPNLTPKNLRAWGEKELSEISSTPQLDSLIFITETLGKDKSFILTNPFLPLAPDEVRSFFSMINRRQTGECVAYITGKKSFFNHEFFVNPHVLVPKSDSELLVEKVVEALGDFTSGEVKIIDVCTGSGCLIISVLREASRIFPQLKIKAWATDISAEALAVAKKNAATICENEEINFRHCNFFRPLDQSRDEMPQSYDIIFSNPPYVPKTVAEELLKDGRGEPMLALDGGEDGCDAIRSLTEQATSLLKKGGKIFIETGEYNAEFTRNLLSEFGFSQVETFADLGDLPRLTRGIKD